MHRINASHELKSQGTEIAFPIGTTSLINANDRTSAPLEIEPDAEMESTFPAIFKKDQHGTQ
jgi:hypothetical protein